MPRNTEAAGRQADEEVGRTFERTVSEGEERLTRGWAPLLATGFVGGLDVGIGVFALFLVVEATDSRVLGALAFVIGFVALHLARSELFTENFLVPIAAVVARPSLRFPALLRLWTGTFAMNLLGGWVLMAIVVAAQPELRATAVELGGHYPSLGIGLTSMASGLLGGIVITLMTWMERGATSTVGRLAAVVGAAYLLAAGGLGHAVIAALEMFAALVAGAGFGYLEAGGTIGWAALWNMIGGVGLVTLLRLIQVGTQKVAEERSQEGVSG